MPDTCTITLQLADIRMTVVADEACRSGLERLSRAWASCLCETDERDSDTVISATLEEPSGQVLIQAGPLVERDEFDVSECHLAIERGLYAELARLLPQDQQMLHAGGVMMGERGVVFLGPSGAGKSSLCLAALERGATYLSDDILITDGSSVRGVARAVQFDPPGQENEFPRWLAEAPLDFETYPRLSKSQDNSTPLFCPGRPRTLRETSAKELCTVVLARGEHLELLPLSRAEALGELVGAAFFRQRAVDLGPLLSRGAFRLTWTDPHRAWKLLEERLA